MNYRLDNTIKKFLAVIFSVVFIFSFQTVYIRNTADAYDIYTVNISQKEISSKGLNTALQTVLNEARKKATDSYHYKVIVPSGKYTVNKSIRLYSNTELCLDGVTLVRDSNAGVNIIRTGDVDSANTGTTGYAYRNITVTGGTLDGSYTGNTIIKIAHAQNILIDSIAMKNVSNGHIMEVAGTDGITVRNCRFSNQTKSSSVGYEALQLDILTEYHFPSYRAEDLPIRNVLIEDCGFYDCPRGIGSHTSIHNNPLNGIVIRNNDFNRMGSAAIQSLNWINCEIYGNTIANTPRGIAMYSVIDSGRGTYSRNYIASQGKTSVHDEYFSNGYGNITIRDNVISPCGNIWDIFAYYENCGIYVGGENVDYTYNRSDGSGNIPHGEHYLDNVAVVNNTIDIGGYGIQVTGTNTDNTFVENNTITCRKSTVSSLEHHGIYLTNHAYLYSVSNNTIKNAETDGIHLEEDSFVTTIQGNHITNSTNFGIDLYNASCGEIWKNTIDKTGANGIEIAYHSIVKNKIMENTISNVKRSGINVSESSKVPEISNNAISSYKKKMVNVSEKAKIKLKNNYNPYVAQSVKITPSDTQLEIGKDTTLEKSVFPTTAKNKMTWNTNNKDIITVDQNGTVHAVGTGTAVVTLTTSNNKTATCKISVRKPPEKIELNKTMLVLGVDERYQLKSILEEDVIEKKITYTSDDETVAKVDENGKITAVGEGEAYITASTYNNKTATCYVSVKSAPTEIFLNAQTLTLGVGETFQLDYTLPDEQTSSWIGYAITPNITVDKNGMITATSVGEATATVNTYNGKSATCHITVEKAPQSVITDKKYIILPLGKETRLLSYTPDYDGNAKVTYTSANENIATIDENGNIFGNTAGIVKVTVQTYNGKFADCIVHIKELPSDITMLTEEKFDNPLLISNQQL